MKVANWLLSGVIIALVVGGSVQGFWMRDSIGDQDALLADVRQGQAALGEDLDRASASLEGLPNLQTVLQGLVETESATRVELQLSREILQEMLEEADSRGESTADMQALLEDLAQAQGVALSEVRQLRETWDGDTGLRAVLDVGHGIQVLPYTNDRGLTAIGVYRSSPPYVARLYIAYPWEATPRLLIDFYATYGYIDLDPPLVNRDDNIFILTTDYSDPAHLLAKILKITPTGVVTEVYSYDCLAAPALGSYFWGMDPANDYLWKGHLRSGGYRIVKSTDGGDSWSVMRDVDISPVPYVYEIAAYEDKVFASIKTTPPVIDYSGDGGITWSTVLSTGISFEGVSLIGRAVYVPNYSVSSVFIFPNYEQPTKWFEVKIPTELTLGQYQVNRQIKQIGNWLVGSALVSTTSSIIFGSSDNFYTISPIFRFSTGGKGSNERFSGFGETIFIGGTGYGDGMLWKGRLPQDVQLRIPCIRSIVSLPSLAPGATSALSDGYVFDSRLGPRFSLTVSATYDVAADDGIRIHVVSSADGLNFDSEDTYTETLPFAPGGTKQKTYSYESSGVIKVQIENLASNGTATDISVSGQLMGVS